MYVCILYSYIFFLKKLLSALFVPVSVAAPVYQTEMSFTPFEKNMVHEIEDRNNPALVNQIATYAFMANLIFLVYKWRIIFCVIDPTTCGSTNINTTNVHMYETLEAPYILAATDMIMSNPSVQNVVPLNFIDLMTSTKNNASSIQELSSQQKHSTYSMLKATPAVKVFQKTVKENVEIKADTATTEKPYVLFFPVQTIPPYSKLQHWPTYRELGYDSYLRFV
jgi:hypothetical protein